MRFLELTAVFIVSFLSLAPAVHATQPNDKQATAAAKLLADDFRPFVITLDRDIQVYHYFQNEKVSGDLPLHSWEWDHQLMRGLNYFWAADRNDAVYAAIDPAISKGHGNLMLEVTLKKGSRILIGHHNIHISSETRAALDNFGYYDDFRFDGAIESINRAILAKALISLNVEAATYNWGGPAPNIACNTSLATFILFGTPNDLDAAKYGMGVIAKTMSVAGYTSDAADFSDTEKRDAYTRINRFLVNSNTATLAGTFASTPELRGISRLERDAWSDMIFTCDSHHSADEPPAFQIKQ